MGNFASTVQDGLCSCVGFCHMQHGETFSKFSVLLRPAACHAHSESLLSCGALKSTSFSISDQFSNSLFDKIIALLPCFPAATPFTSSAIHIQVYLQTWWSTILYLLGHNANIWTFFTLSRQWSSTEYPLSAAIQLADAWMMSSVQATKLAVSRQEVHIDDKDTWERSQ